MKVIGIVGSPRKGGNTEILVESVLEGAKRAGAEIEIYRLNDLTINGCQGCNYCQEHGSCQQEDDMKKLYDALHQADGIVIGSPIYMDYVTAQTKLFLDRLFALMKIGEGCRLHAGKKCVLVYSQGGGDTGQAVMESLAMFFKSVLNMDVKGIIGGNGLNELGAVKNRREVLERAFELGKEIVKG